MNEPIMDDGFIFTFFYSIREVFMVTYEKNGSGQVTRLVMSISTIGRLSFLICSYNETFSSDISSILDEDTFENKGFTL